MMPLDYFQQARTCFTHSPLRYSTEYSPGKHGHLDEGSLNGGFSSVLGTSNHRSTNKANLAVSGARRFNYLVARWRRVLLCASFLITSNTEVSG